MLMSEADLSSSLTPGLVVNALDFSRARMSSGRSRREAELGRTPGWLIHCNIFHLSMVSTHTLIKASLASARLGLRVLSTAILASKPTIHC